MTAIKPIKLITAIGTPLDDADGLCADGVAAQLDDQADAGIEGVLVAGTMGAMQMLPDRTWQDLVRRSSELNRGRFELLVGVTDQSTARVLDRVRFAQGVGGIDGLVALTPSAIALSETERIDFYRAVADAATLPLYIYELAPATGVIFSLEALVALAAHPNIAGVKISCNLHKARALFEHDLPGFRVIPAEPQFLDMCAATGPWTEHLDGIFAATPHWAKTVVEHVAAGNHDAAAVTQRRINGLLRRWVATGQVMAAFTATMNARGIPGRYHPRPMRGLANAARQELLNSPEVSELVATTGRYAVSSNNDGTA